MVLHRILPKRSRNLRHSGERYAGSRYAERGERSTMVEREKKSAVRKEVG